MSKEDVVIHRQANTTPSIVLTNSLSSTPAIRNDLHEFAGFVLEGVSAAVDVTYYVSADGENFYALNDASNAAVDHDITDDRAYTFPEETKPFPWLKLVLDAEDATAHLVRKS